MDKEKAQRILNIDVTINKDHLLSTSILSPCKLNSEEAKERLNNIIEAELKGAMSGNKVPRTEEGLITLRNKMLKALNKAVDKGIQEGIIDPTFERKQLNGDQNE